ncbi:hypothetical protein [Hymenobacter artigasi]|uniref:hypothetical protein n=1 Tax=Hymenobacter artigasi TaxID=2719616 RepID=UPI0036D28E0E
MQTTSAHALLEIGQDIIAPLVILRFGNEPFLQHAFQIPQLNQRAIERRDRSRFYGLPGGRIGTPGALATGIAKDDMAAFAILLFHNLSPFKTDFKYPAAPPNDAKAKNFFFFDY